MAEVFKFADLKEEGSEAAVKVFNIMNLPLIKLSDFQISFLLQAAGKYRQQGKAYIVEDGDIILFKFNAGAGLTAGKDAKKK